MKIKNAHYNAIMREYNRRQFQHQHEQDLRIQEIYQNIPRIREIQGEIVTLSVSQAKSAILHPDFSSQPLKHQLASLSAEREALLKSHGYPADYMDLHYTCPICKDTGYIHGKACVCLKQALIRQLYDQSNIRDILEKENFDALSLSYYGNTLLDNGQTTRQYMEQVIGYARSYVQDYKIKKPSLLLYGQTGVGKTFLSNCIAKGVLDQYMSVVYLTATQLFDIFSQDTFGDRDLEEEPLSPFILDCDLLIIDDLGTELTNSFTNSKLFYCINERLLRKVGTIISTNLSMNDLRDTYSERVVSRIVGNYETIRLPGEDIRLKKKFSHLRGAE